MTNREREKGQKRETLTKNEKGKKIQGREEEDIEMNFRGKLGLESQYIKYAQVRVQRQGVNCRGCHTCECNYAYEWIQWQGQPALRRILPHLQ
jgi:hypothetical protein